MLLSSIFLFVFLFAETRGDPSWQPDTKTRNIHSLGHANNYFGVNLLKKLAQGTEGNVFFSPFSVSSVIAMLYSGARGETAEELKKALGYRRINDSVVFSSFHFYLTEIVDNTDPRLYTLNSVSAMVVDKSIPVLEQYKSDIRDVFQAYVQEADIAQESAAVADGINTWAKIKTKGAISDLADNIDPETILFLASAAYFKGTWKVKFDPRDTKYHPFYNGGRRANVSNVLMMHSHAVFRYFDGDGEDFTAVEMLYEGRNISMVIYLPKQFRGLYNLEREMTASRLSYVRRDMFYRKLHLTVPKFKLEYHKNLCKVLQELGVSKIFRGVDADLSGMVEEGTTLALNEVKHKALIEVDEQGSVASAVTRAIMTKSIPVPLEEFKANHPFLFAIFDTISGMILFMGRVTNF